MTIDIRDHGGIFGGGKVKPPKYEVLSYNYNHSNASALSFVCALEIKGILVVFTRDTNAQYRSVRIKDGKVLRSGVTFQLPAYATVWDDTIIIYRQTTTNMMGFTFYDINESTGELILLKAEQIVNIRAQYQMYQVAIPFIHNGDLFAIFIDNSSGTAFTRVTKFSIASDYTLTYVGSNMTPTSFNMSVGIQPVNVDYRIIDNTVIIAYGGATNAPTIYSEFRLTDLVNTVDRVQLINGSGIQNIYNLYLSDEQVVYLLNKHVERPILYKINPTTNTISSSIVFDNTNKSLIRNLPVLYSPPSNWNFRTTLHSSGILAEDSNHIYIHLEAYNASTAEIQLLIKVNKFDFTDMEYLGDSLNFPTGNSFFMPRYVQGDYRLLTNFHSNNRSVDVLRMNILKGG